MAFRRMSKATPDAGETSTLHTALSAISEGMEQGRKLWSGAKVTSESMPEH